MVTPSRRGASFYCYLRYSKLFIIVSNNSLCIKSPGNCRAAIFWRNLKIRHHCINAYGRNRIFNIARWMQSSVTDGVNGKNFWHTDGHIFPAASWHSVQNIKKVQLRTESMQWAAQYFSIDTHVLRRNGNALLTPFDHLINNTKSTRAVSRASWKTRRWSVAWKITSIRS